MIYLDHNASSPTPRPILEELVELFRQSTASPSSAHTLGRQSKRLINEATENIAKLLDTSPEGVYWTSGASEANSWILHSTMTLARSAGRKPRLILSSLEHDSVRAASQALSQQGVRVDWINATSHGTIDLDHLKKLLSTPDSIDLVSILHSNNETGVLQPLDKAITMCREKHIPVHVDCVQALGKHPLALRTLGATYTTFSGHKIGAPKGVGFVVIDRQESLKLAPLVYGKQQNEKRGGTQNTFGIVATARVLKFLKDQTPLFTTRLSEMKRKFENELKNKVPGTIIHGESSERLCNTSFVGFEGIDGNGVLMNLDLEGICASSGSACSSGTLEPSHVLAAMGCAQSLARSSVRFSAGFETQWSDYERVLSVLPKIVERVRKA